MDSNNDNNQDNLVSSNQELVNLKLQQQAIKQFLSSDAGLLMIGELEKICDSRTHLHAVVEEVYYNGLQEGATLQQQVDSIASKLQAEMQSLTGAQAVLTRLKQMGSI